MESTLPKSVEPVTGLETASAIGEETSGNKVLIVEDDAGWRSILAELLMDTGHEVRLSASFGDALGNLRREKFVLAIVDLSLTDEAVWGEDRNW